MREVPCAACICRVVTEVIKAYIMAMMLAILGAVGLVRPSSASQKLCASIVGVYSSGQALVRTCHSRVEVIGIDSEGIDFLLFPHGDRLPTCCRHSVALNGVLLVRFSSHVGRYGIYLRKGCLCHEGEGLLRHTLFLAGFCPVGLDVALLSCDCPT